MDYGRLFILLLNFCYYYTLFERNNDETFEPSRRTCYYCLNAKNAYNLMKNIYTDNNKKRMTNNSITFWLKKINNSNTYAEYCQLANARHARVENERERKGLA